MQTLKRLNQQGMYFFTFFMLTLTTFVSLEAKPFKFFKTQDSTVIVRNSKLMCRQNPTYLNRVAEREYNRAKSKQKSWAGASKSYTAAKNVFHGLSIFNQYVKRCSLNSQVKLNQYYYLYKTMDYSDKALWQQVAKVMGISLIWLLKKTMQGVKHMNSWFEIINTKLAKITDYRAKIASIESEINAFRAKKYDSLRKPKEESYDIIDGSDWVLDSGDEYTYLDNKTKAVSTSTSASVSSESNISVSV